MGQPDNSSEAVGRNSGAFEPPIPGYVDWIVAAIIALGGLFLTIGGSVLVFVVNRDFLAEGIESGQVSIGLVDRELSRAEMLDFVAGIVDWTGFGLLLTGIALVVFAIGYAVVRHRRHGRTAAGESAGSFRSYAITGGAASAVLSFIPFSPIVGSGLAGYLGHQDTGHSTSVGAFSGFLYVLPGLVILLFLTIGVFVGLSNVGEAGIGYVLFAVMLLVMLIVSAYGAGVGALGGFLGGRLAED
jgi:hypothetical protein